MPFRAVLILLASILAGVSAGAQTTPPPKPAAEAAEDKIDGLEIARAGGTFLGLKLQGVQLQVTFYDAKKKKVPADAVRIAARWQDHVPRRAVLLPTGPETLQSPPVFKPPYDYRIFLVLVGADDRELETLQINPAVLPKG